MKLLMHACCAPCLLYPLERFRLEGVDSTIYFYNPNIHPYREYERRVNAMIGVAEQKDLRVIWDIPPEDEDYGITMWMMHMKDKRERRIRCPECYRMRLEMTAQNAIAYGFSAFSTTLLYSTYQMHNLIKLLGFSIGNKYGLEFVYRDFREGWQEGVDMAIKMNIYRQPYCGCVYSEQERYEKRAAQLFDRLVKKNKNLMVSHTLIK